MADLKSNPTYQAIKELSLALIYLTRFGNRGDETLRTSWIGYDREIIHDLIEEEMLRGRSRYQTTLSDEGIEKAQEILKKYKIPDWE